MKGNILFVVKSKENGLAEMLKLFEAHGIVTSILEQMENSNNKDQGQHCLEFDMADEDSIQKLKPFLTNMCETLVINVSNSTPKGAPWFPRHLSDLDSCSVNVTDYGADLSIDHPGFTDQEYRHRRKDIVAIATAYKSGLPIPRIEYTEKEIDTWRTVFDHLIKLYPTHACREYIRVFPELGYTRDRIPQLEDVSNFLKSHTGFSLKPVMGLLSPRDFLNGLAFRVFHCTQYIRHYSKPLYTPEPDVCHELLGHVPLFADPSFAAFSQEIGLASLGASDKDIVKLASIYWFSVEFGLCREGPNIKAYGAGLLSSYGELEYALTDKPTLKPFDCDQMSATAYPVTNYQPVYFVANSFKQAQKQIRLFASGLERPLTLRYNPFSRTIEELDSREKILDCARELESELQTMIHALSCLE